MTCYCPNNVMLVEQVANWLSFRKAWQTMLDEPHEWYLLLEDDIKFTSRAEECWNALVTRELLAGCAGSPCIIRCGWQLGWDYIDDLPPEIAEGIVRMSNHCSILNRSMAQILLADSASLLCSTSDIFVHEHTASQHRNLTLFPPISYDLSFALQMPSLIRPKGVSGDDPVRTAELRKAVRITPNNTRAWLDTLTWAPACACELHPKYSLLATVEGTRLQHWADLEPEQRGLATPIPIVGDPSFVVERRGQYVVLDPESPPSWIYSARCFYVGDDAKRPRGYLPLGQLLR